MKQTMLLIFIIILISVRCDTNEPPTSKESLSLALEDVSCTEAWIKLTTTNLPLPTSILLKQNDVTRATINLTTADTLLYIDSLFPKQTYSFQVSSIQNQVSSNQATATTLDTTSHNFTWQVDTLGDIQSSVDGIWGSSPNDIWAVGTFTTNRQTSRIAHYNGIAWEYLYPSSFHDLTGLQSGDLSGIYGVGKNDIWVSGNGFRTDPFTQIDSTWGFVGYWNGFTWKNISPAAPYIGFNDIWASDKNNVWVVGSNGAIFYYNGVEWTKQVSGTTYILWDIFGTNSKNVYAVGFSQDNADGIFLKYNGVNWLSEEVADPLALGSYRSVWMLADKSIWVAGEAGLFHNFGIGWQNLGYLDTDIGFSRIRGKGHNDVWVGGSFGLMAHFNGFTWKINLDILHGQHDSYINDILIFNEKVFLVGRGGQGFYIKGIVFSANR